jgi:hypothetical protein
MLTIKNCLYYYLYIMSRDIEIVQLKAKQLYTIEGEES